MKIVNFIGDAVYSLSETYIPYSQYEGTYAEYVRVKEEWIAKAPSSLSLKDSSAVPLVYLTALQALEKAEPKTGHRILILGASGAVGQFGIQLAKLLYNLHVTAVSSPNNFELVNQLGADEIWDYAKGAAGLIDDYSNKKFDIIFDVIGGELLDASAKVLVDGGVITHIMNRGTNGADGINIIINIIIIIIININIININIININIINIISQIQGTI